MCLSSKGFPILSILKRSLLTFILIFFSVAMLQNSPYIYTPENVPLDNSYKPQLMNTFIRHEDSKYSIYRESRPTQKNKTDKTINDNKANESENTRLDVFNVVTLFICLSASLCRQ